MSDAACGHHDEHGGVRRAAQQRGEQLHRRGVRPVDVVEGEHERLGGRQPLDQLAHGAVRAVALVLRDGAAARRWIRERRQHVREFAAHLIAQGRHEPRVQSGDVLVEGVDEDPERQVALQLGCAAAETDAPQASARLASSANRRVLPIPARLGSRAAPSTVAQFAERMIDCVQFGGAPDKWVGDLGHEWACLPSITRRRVGARSGCPPMSGAPRRQSRCMPRFLVHHRHGPHW